MYKSSKSLECFDLNIVYCYNHYNHLESYKQQVLVIFDEK